MVLVDHKKATGKCINMKKIYNLCDEIESRSEKVTIGFFKASPKYSDDINNMFLMILDLFFREEKFQRRNSFTKSVPCRRKSMVFEIENAFESSCFLKMSPSLISLNEFSSDEDIEKSNFKI